MKVRPGCIPVLVLMAALAAGPTAAWARFQPPTCKNAFSVEQEISEGKKAEAQVYQQMPVLPDSSPVSQYVQQLGAKLVKYAPGYKWPFRFHVVDAADINAFALPGGAIFVNLGTIQAAETEAQLAGVMAHETSHVVLRHATCNITKEQKQLPFWAIGQMAASVLLGGAAGNLAATGIGFGAQTLFLRYSRDAEKQADLLGTDILYDAGYDPRGMVQFFEIIQGKYGNGGAQFLSDHPNPGNRAEYVNQEIASLPPKANYIRTTPEFKAIKKEVSKMKAYTAKEIQSGAWKKNAPSQKLPSGVQAPSANWMPQGKWQSLQTQRFSLSYPGNWHAYQAQSGASATIAPEGGIADLGNGQNAVIYGVLTDTFQPQGANGLNAAMDQLLAQIKQGNPQMKILSAPRDLTVNSRPARDVEATNISESGGNGSAEHDWIVGIQQPDGGLRYVVFVAPARDFEKLRPSFEQMLRSLHVQ